MSGDDEHDPFSALLYPSLHTPTARDEAALLAEVRHSTLEKCREAAELRRQLRDRYADELVSCGRALAAAFAAGGFLLTFGNGGSATDAQDLAADFLYPPRPHDRPLPALALTGDGAIVTAVGNDVGFDNVFARQIIAYGRRGDIAVGFSTSGNSPNLLAAFAQARARGLLTIGFSGYDGGKLAQLALDFCFVVPSVHIPRIQEAQATLYHILCEQVWHHRRE